MGIFAVNQRLILWHSYCSVSELRFTGKVNPNKTIKEITPLFLKNKKIEKVLNGGARETNNGVTDTVSFLKYNH